MLTQQENEILTQVGPGTPMGNLMRRYWIPAMLSAELAEPNCDPMRVRLLGENFVAWRDAEGRPALFDECCMHRGASLALARCEGDGLRCIYHGWKFAADGKILETPNYRQPTVREKLTAPVYPVREAGDMIWVYLGPREKIPEFPSYRFLHVSPEHRGVKRAVIDCNWVQSLEGHLDSSHASILHKDWDPFGKVSANQVRLLRGGIDIFTEDDAPLLEVEDTIFGFHTAAIRDAVEAGKRVGYARVHAFALPFMCVVPSGGFTFEVPIDDEHVNLIGVLCNPARPVDRSKYLALTSPREYFSEWSDAGVLHYAGTPNNRWFQDRGRMRRGESFSGIGGLTVEDASVVVSMGPVYERTKEHLVPADVAVIRMRRLLLRAAQQLQQGIEPRMLTAAETSCIQAADGVLRDGQLWQDLVPDNVAIDQTARDDHADLVVAE
jgi:nitrite reductase/ring-hydroxylating ferredoxin subunit